MGDIVVDADSEVVLRTRLLQFVEHALCHRGGEFLGRQAITAAHDPGLLGKRRSSARKRLAERRHDILVQRFAQGAGSLVRSSTAIDLTVPAARQGRRPRQTAGTAGPSATLAFRPQHSGGGSSLRPHRQPTHQNNHPLGIGSANVIKEMVARPVSPANRPSRSARSWGRPGSRDCRLPRLEEHVGILRGPAKDGVIRAQRPRAVAQQRLPRHMARIVSSEIASALLISCEVRNPSKKCMNGTRASRVEI